MGLRNIMIYYVLIGLESFVMWFVRYNEKMYFWVVVVIMVLLIIYWVWYVDGYIKFIRKSEKVVDSDRVLKFVLDKEYYVILVVV